MAVLQAVATAPLGSVSAWWRMHTPQSTLSVFISTCVRNVCNVQQKELTNIQRSCMKYCHKWNPGESSFTRVPTERICDRWLTLKSPAKIAATRPTQICATTGVWCLGWIFAKNEGNNPSRPSPRYNRDCHQHPHSWLQLTAHLQVYKVNYNS